MTRKTASDFDQGLIDLYDGYAHGRIDRREFLDRAAKYAVGGLTAAALLDILSPDYAQAQQVAPDDPRITADVYEFPSPNGSGTMRGLLAMPAGVEGKLPGVVVIHENRGLNPYIEDVARRLAVEGFMALAPDGLTPLGGYPGSDEQGRDMQRQLDRAKLKEDLFSAFDALKSHQRSTGKIGAVGFCFGGGVVNEMAVRFPDLAAAVPFYGDQPPAEDVPAIQAPLLLHYAGLDERVNAGFPAFEEALKANGKTYTAHVYPGVNHAFHNDTTPRYDEAAATLAWERTIAFFKQHLS